MDTITKASDTSVYITPEKKEVAYEDLLKEQKAMLNFFNSEKARADEILARAQEALDAINAKIAEAKKLLLIK